MPERSRDELRLFIEYFKPLVKRRLANFSGFKALGSFEVDSTGIVNRQNTDEAFVIFSWSSEKGLRRFGYRTTSKEIAGQSPDSMSRATYLAWLDIESELLWVLDTVGYESQTPDDKGIVWLMDD
jgi:hypothetical protein